MSEIDVSLRFQGKFGFFFRLKRYQIMLRENNILALTQVEICSCAPVD